MTIRFPVKVLFASSEVTPFAKTGGLADVAGALPRYLEPLGIDVSVFMPAYQPIHDAGDFRDTGIRYSVPMGPRLVEGGLLESRLPDSKVRVLAVENRDYFHRDGLYGENGSDYHDNCERFVFFCRSMFEIVRALDWQPDLLHVNDWQTGLIPAILQSEYSGNEGWDRTPALMTIHNLAYQGNFWHWDMLLTGLDWKYFNWEQMEFFGQLNLLKTGLVFADAINTVSPTYASEIQTSEHGCGLEGVLRSRSDVLSGILNGIGSEWDPATDPHLAVNYDANSWEAGKAACKAALRSKRCLPQRPEVPLIGLIGRLAEQKGWSLILPVMESWLGQVDAQWIVLGTGQPEYHDALQELAARHPESLSLELGFSAELAHQIESAADMFLMPSRYEPCGLNQQYSLAYGTPPIVRATGGLADTVVDAIEENIVRGTANGFSFAGFTVPELESAMGRAVEMYYQRKETWKQLVTNGMNQDWTWTSSARRYERLYQQTIARKRAHQGAVRNLK